MHNHCIKLIIGGGSAENQSTPLSLHCLQRVCHATIGGNLQRVLCGVQEGGQHVSNLLVDLLVQYSTVLQLP